MRQHGKVDRFHQCQSGTNDHGTMAGGCPRKELEPEQLFIDLSLLICEARHPEFSDRGRVQGPHCPGDSGQQSVAGAAKSVDGFQTRHICDEANEKCKSAREIETELRQRWSRGIPACLTVLLLPDECSKQDNCMAEALILEKWTIQQVERRNRDDKLLPGQFLLQAVRSHLHFSQLSAWLIASRGKAPANVVYRVCLPGELETSVSASASDSSASSFAIASLGCTSSSGMALERHQFPLCSAGKHLALSVMVESTPRSAMLPSRSCCCLRPSTSGILTSTDTEQKTGELSSSISAPAIVSAQSSNAMSSSRYRRNEDGIPELVVEEEEESPQESDSQPSPSDTSRTNSCHSFNNESSPSPPKPASNETTQEDTSDQQQLAFVPLSLPPMVSSAPAQHDRRQGVSATNPLFDISAPTPNPLFLNSKYHLKNRVDALRNEACVLSAKLRTLSSSSNSSSAANSKLPSRPSIGTSRNGGKPRFFLADDDEDDDRLEDDHSAKASSHDSAKVRESKASRRILFTEQTASAIDECSFSEWINQTVDGAGDLETESGVENVDESQKEDQIDGDASRDDLIRDKYELTASASASKANSGHTRRVKRIPSAASAQFHPRTGLPLSSSPAPLKRNHSSFNYDPLISSVSTLKSALYYHDHESGGSSDSDSGWPLCKSAPASTHLLGSFEESALNGRIRPNGSVDGFTLELGASGAFCPSHVTLPVTTLFFNVSDDNAPSPYFGLCSLENVGRRGYYVPKKGSVQATLFNPQGTVVKMFVVRYDLCDMPPSCQTFVRQRTFFMPSTANLRDAMENRSWLRYLIHLRFASSSSGKLFLHTDIRMLFSRKSELESYNLKCADVGASSSSDVDTYELRSFTEMPKDPKFSPRKFSRSDRQK